MLAWLNLHSVYVDARDDYLACLYSVFSFSAFWDTSAMQNVFPLMEPVYVIKYPHLSETEETVISLYRWEMPDLGINSVGTKEAFSFPILFWWGSSSKSQNVLALEASFTY